MPDIKPEDVDIITPSSLGQGITAARSSAIQKQYDEATEDTDKKARTVTTPDGKTYLLDKVGLKNWSSRPAFPGQFQVERGRKIGPTTTKVFNLSKDLDEFNALMEQASPQGEFYDLDPAIIIVNLDKHFWEGSFYVCVSYQPIYYALPIKKY